MENEDAAVSARDAIIIGGICVAAVIAAAANSIPADGWPNPSGPPSERHAAAVLVMLREHCAASGSHLPDGIRVVHWWQGDAVPQFYSREFGPVRAESLVKSERIDSDGNAYKTDWLFLRWNGGTPYCVAIIRDSLDVPQRYR